MLPDARPAKARDAGPTSSATPSSPVVYMDNQATTPVDERVLAAMWPYFREVCGNAASRSHAYGWAAEEAVALARQEVAALIGARPRDIVFTSGATESDNLAIKGVVEAYQDRGNHVVTCVTEHKAVLDTCRSLERTGRARVTYLPVDGEGRVDPEDVRHALTDQTILVSIMAANNEVGTLQPIREIGRITRAAGVLFHCDATQAAGKVPLDVARDGLDLLSLSAHKMYGPKGCGALYVRGSHPRVRILSQMDGGGHERGLRSGTLNVPGIVGFGKACELCRFELDADAGRLRSLQAMLLDALTSELDGVHLNGHATERIPGNLHLSFAGVEGEALLLGVTKAVAVSSGSACTSATMSPSYVLQALGVDNALALASIRFGLGRFNTPADVDIAAARVLQVVRRLRAH